MKELDRSNKDITDKRDELLRKLLSDEITLKGFDKEMAEVQREELKFIFGLGRFFGARRRNERIKEIIKLV